MCSYILPLFNIFFFARVEIAIDERSVSVMELQRPRRHKRLERVYRIQQERQIEGYVASLSLTDQPARIAPDHQVLFPWESPTPAADIQICRAGRGEDFLLPADQDRRDNASFAASTAPARDDSSPGRHGSRDRRERFDSFE